MTFEHNYAGSIDQMQVIYIEYVDGIPHAVVTRAWIDTAKTPYWRCYYFDFYKDMDEVMPFMFYHSGSGGDPMRLQAPQFIKPQGESWYAYWMAPDASYAPGTFALNAKRLDEPIAYEGDPNPFNHGRECYYVTYCKFCQGYYDEHLCNQHHRVVDPEDQKPGDPDVIYIDGTPVEE